MKAKPADETYLFSNQDLKRLILPLLVEQLLAITVGMADSIMVSSVGEAAVSGVSLVDSINVLVIQVFSALAAGGAIICSQYIGQGDTKNARYSAEQLLLVTAGISIFLTVICIGFNEPLLRLIFGEVEAAVMENSMTYFFFTALSFPFIALYNAGASVFRAQQNTGLPMTVSVISWKRCGKMGEDIFS